MTAPFLLRQSLFASFALAIGCAPVLALAETAANGVPLELPKITVTEQRELPPPEAWRYAQIPGLEILSSVPDRETQKLLRDFRLFNAAIGVVWPALKTHRPVPMSLILCGARRNFAAFVPAGDNKFPIARASVFLKNSDQVAFVLNFGAKTIDLALADTDAPAPTEGTAMAGVELAGSNVQVDLYRQLYREYVRYQLSYNQPRLPAWLEEGLAQLLMGIRVDPKFIEFAKLEDPNLAPAIAKLREDDPDGLTPPGANPQEQRDFNATLHHKGLIPLADFFAVSHNSPTANNPFAGKWAKQAQALVHLWLYGEGKRFNPAFARFVARSTQEPVTEAMFKDCFKVSYDDMLTALRIYIENTAYVHQEFNAKQGGGLPEPAPLALRDATAAEVGLIKGETLLLAEHPNQARTELIAPYLRGERDPRLLAALGLLELSRGESARARKFLEAAAQARGVHPRASLELAKLRLADAQPSAPADNDSPLNAAQTAAVLQPLLLARQQPPPLPEVYELMAEVWRRSETPPTKQDLGLLNQGVVLFQRRPLLLLHAAELNGKYGDPAVAHAFVDFGLKLAKTSEARQVFEEVKAALPALPAK